MKKISTGVKDIFGSFFKELFGFLKAITVGVFKDKKLSSGRKANILCDVIMIVPCIVGYFKCSEYVALAGFAIFALFTGWCLATVK